MNFEHCNLTVHHSDPVLAETVLTHLALQITDVTQEWCPDIRGKAGYVRYYYSGKGFTILWVLDIKFSSPVPYCAS